MTLLTLASPFALKRVPNGGSSALLAASSRRPSVVKAISSTRVVPPVGMLCFSALAVGASRSNTLRVLFPSPPSSRRTMARR